MSQSTIRHPAGGCLEDWVRQSFGQPHQGAPSMYTFRYIRETGLSQKEVLRRARAMVRAAPYPLPIQQAIDAVIDAALEWGKR